MQGQLGQLTRGEGEGGIDPWSLTWKQERPAPSAHLPHLCCPAHPIACLPWQDAHQIPEQVHKRGASSFSRAGRAGEATGLLLFLGLQAGRRSSLGGWEQPVLEGRGRGREDSGEGLAEDEDVHARWGKVQGSHRFWQHCSLLGFCPSVVGGTLMSTTLLPGDSSWAARSAICFCDTIR